jgi:4-diphosphocytidyl-2-C-methyl-D-erythritol kinase
LISGGNCYIAGLNFVMDAIKVKAPAKINLFLKVIGKRPDGYHDIWSWFQAIDLFDHLTLIKRRESGFKIEVSGEFTAPADESNTVWKACNLFFERFDLPGGLEISLEKHIPTEAGLGGGSADAAATIYAVNRLYGLDLSTGVMAETGLEIGSDMPFFFSSGQAEITGRGENIRNIELPTDYYVVLIKPGFGLSTAEGYRLLKMDLTRPMGGIKLLRCKNFKAMVDAISEHENDFERVQFDRFPELAQIKRELASAGAQVTRMSGSGPTIFGLFDKLPERGIVQRIAGGSWLARGLRPISLPAWE